MTQSHELDPIEYWRLCDQLSLVQAALLILGQDPSDHPVNLFEQSNSLKPKGFTAVYTALLNAGMSQNLKVVPYIQSDNEGFEHENWSYGTVEVSELKRWLSERGATSNFFFPKSIGTAFLDHSHPRFAPKLFAAVKAWEAVTKPTGRSPKQALMKWLRENAADLGLADDDGKPSEQAIEDISKVANWEPGGGAPRTPGG